MHYPSIASDVAVPYPAHAFGTGNPAGATLLGTSDLSGATLEIQQAARVTACKTDEVVTHSSDTGTCGTLGDVSTKEERYGTPTVDNAKPPSARYGETSGTSTAVAQRLTPADEWGGPRSSRPGHSQFETSWVQYMHHDTVTGSTAPCYYNVATKQSQWERQAEPFRAEQEWQLMAVFV